MLDETSGAKTKIDKETAEAEFIRYCENNRIEYDETALNDEEKETFADIKKRFVKACVEGRVEVDGTSLKYTVSDFSPEAFRGKIIKINRPGGHAFAAMDGYNSREEVHKLMGFMSAMTGQEMRYFSKIDIIDWKFFNAMATNFLGL